MSKIGGNFEHGYEAEDRRLTPVYKKISELLLNGAINVGHDGNLPDDPFMGDFAQLTPPNRPPETEGALAELPPDIEPMRWSGNVLMRHGH